MLGKPENENYANLRTLLAVLKFAQNARGEREISEEKIRAVWSGFTLGVTRV